MDNNVVIRGFDKKSELPLLVKFNRLTDKNC